MLHSNEITPGRGHFYSRHRDARHSGNGFDYPRPAQANSRFSWRPDDRRSEMERSVRSGLRANAIFLFTLARRFVGSIRKTPDHPALKPRSRIGLHRDGDGAHVKLAIPRPNYFRNHDFKHSDCNGLHRGRHAERKTSWSVWAHRRGIRDRVHIWTCNWRVGGRRQSASRFLDSSHSKPGELALGLLLRSGIALARPAKNLSTAPFKSGWLADTTTFASRTLATDLDPVSCVFFPQRF